MLALALRPRRLLPDPADEAFAVAARDSNFPLIEDGFANMGFPLQTRRLVGRLDVLPHDVLREILIEIGSVRVLRAVAVRCPSAANVLNTDGDLWQQIVRNHWDCHFDGGAVTLHDLRKLAEVRQASAASTRRFQNGQCADDIKAIEVMRALLVGAFTTRKSNGRRVSSSRNLAILRDMADERRFFDCAIYPRVEDGATLSFSSVAVCLVGFRFEQPTLDGINFHESRRRAHAVPPAFPLFYPGTLLNVDTSHMLHMQLFWFGHLSLSQYPLGCRYDRLDASERIKAPRGPVRAGVVQMGQQYYGEYAFAKVSGAHRSRRRAAGSFDVTEDTFRGDGPHEEDFQTLDITWSDGRDPNSEIWFRRWERSLNSSRGLGDAQMRLALRRDFASLHRIVDPQPPFASTPWPAIIPTWESQHHPNAQLGGSRYFTARGSDHGEPFAARGRVAPLPAQRGIPGFQRFTMVKYFPHWWYPSNVGNDRAQWPNDMPADPFDVQEHRPLASAAGDIDEEMFFCYEGIVAPGGELVVGRHFRLSSEMWPGQGIGLDRHQQPYHLAGEAAFGEHDAQYLEVGPFIFWCVDSKAP